MSPTTKPGPKRKPETCRTCGGNCTVPVDPRDPRKGDRQCPNCGGMGEING